MAKIRDSYYKKLAQVESSPNDQYNEESGAAGIYQFTESTWKDWVDRLGLDYTLDDRFDARKSNAVVKKFTESNKNFLESRLGREIGEGELYLAHFLGPAGAVKMLSNLNKTIDQTNNYALGSNTNRNVLLHKDQTPKTNAEVLEWANSKFGASSNIPHPSQDAPESASSSLSFTDTYKPTPPIKLDRDQLDKIFQESQKTDLQAFIDPIKSVKFKDGGNMKQPGPGKGKKKTKKQKKQEYENYLRQNPNAGNPDPEELQKNMKKESRFGDFSPEVLEALTSQFDYLRNRFNSENYDNVLDLQGPYFRDQLRSNRKSLREKVTDKIKDEFEDFVNANRVDRGQEPVKSARRILNEQRKDKPLDVRKANRQASSRLAQVEYNLNNMRFKPTDSSTRYDSTNNIYYINENEFDKNTFLSDFINTKGSLLNSLSGELGEFLRDSGKTQVSNKQKYFTREFPYLEKAADRDYYDRFNKGKNHWALYTNLDYLMQNNSMDEIKEMIKTNPEKYRDLNTAVNTWDFDDVKKITYKDGGLLTQFNTGGKHEENPLGGIPQGPQALVEEGETRNGDYIFSDSLFLDDNIIKKFNLGGLAKPGMSIADYTKAVNAPLEERPFDKVEKGSAQRLINQAKLANEYMRLGGKMKKSKDVYVTGGKINPYLQAATMLTSMLPEGEVQRTANSAVQGAGIGTMIAPGIGTAIGAIGGAGIGLAKELMGPKYKDVEAEAHMKKYSNHMKMGGKIYDDGGPIEDAVLAYLKANNGDNYVTLQRQLDAKMADPDYDVRKDPAYKAVIDRMMRENQGQEFNTLDPTGIFGDIERDKMLYNAMDSASINAANPKEEYSRGLNDNVASIYSDTPFMGTGNSTPTPESRPLLDKVPVTPAGIERAIDFEADPFDVYDTGDIDKFLDTFNTPEELDLIPFTQKREDSSNNEDNNDNKIKFDPNDLLRFAPTVSNLSRLINAPDAEVERLDRLDNRYKKDLFDVQTPLNELRNQAGATRRAIQNTAMGSAGVARANLLAADLNTKKGIGNVFAIGDNVNRQQNQIEQEFNRGTDQFNIGQSNNEKQINAGNRAAAFMYRDALKAGIGEQLGQMGTEESLHEAIQNALGYDRRGRKVSKYGGILSDMFSQIQGENKLSDATINYLKQYGYGDQ